MFGFLGKTTANGFPKQQTPLAYLALDDTVQIKGELTQNSNEWEAPYGGFHKWGLIVVYGGYNI